MGDQSLAEGAPIDPRREDDDVPARERGPGWRAFVVAAAFYTVCVAIATWPRVLWFRSSLPSLLDPLQHLWIMRWYRACLFEGQSLVLCPEVQYPIGAPLGCFSPLHPQGLLYIVVSLAIPNDILCYNLIWMFGMVSTGLATFLLAWRVIGDRWCAGFAGLLAMLSAPLMLHASAHLELIFLGAFPFFLWNWMRFLDRPGRGRLAAAVGGFVLLALCAAYFAVYAVFPAALYFFWKGLAAGRRGAVAWFRDRLRWLLAFTAVVLPCLVVVFANQLWALGQGYALPRSFGDFQRFNTPLWSYACPSFWHALGRAYPSSWYAATGMVPKMGECCSYLGVVALLLLAYAAAFHVRFRDASYWWACLALLVVLSGGTSWTIAGYEITLPGLWLKRHLFLFRMIRVPARFNLYAAVIAAVVAAGGLHHLLQHLRFRWLRGGILAALTVGVVADLAMVPYFNTRVPSAPGCYAFLHRAAPGAAFVEVPQSGSEGSDLYSILAYWQSFHRGRTTAGYCGQGNAVFDNLVTDTSPFSAEAIGRPEYLDHPEKTPLPLLGDVDFGAYAWLYLHAHGFRHVVLHKEADLVAPSVGLERLKTVLAGARVFEDEGSIVYDRDRLPPPRTPVMLTTRGWRKALGRGPLRVAEREAHLLVYNPDPDRPLHLGIDAKSLYQARQVRLLWSGHELARWEVLPGEYQSLPRRPFRLPAGLHVLVLESDRTARPHNRRDAAEPTDTAAYSLKVERLELDTRPAVALRPAETR